MKLQDESILTADKLYKNYGNSKLSGGDNILTAYEKCINYMTLKNI